MRGYGASISLQGTRVTDLLAIRAIFSSAISSPPLPASSHPLVVQTTVILVCLPEVCLVCLYCLNFLSICIYQGNYTPICIFICLITTSPVNYQI